MEKIIIPLFECRRTSPFNYLLNKFKEKDMIINPTDFNIEDDKEIAKILSRLFVYWEYSEDIRSHTIVFKHSPYWKINPSVIRNLFKSKENE